VTGQPDAELYLYDAVHSARLWKVMDYARRTCPILWTGANGGSYIVTRYEDVRVIAEDPATFSSRVGDRRLRLSDGKPSRCHPVE
jgi:hypothetical protein